MARRSAPDTPTRAGQAILGIRPPPPPIPPPPASLDGDDLLEADE